MTAGDLRLQWLDAHGQIGSPDFSRYTRNVLTAVKAAALLLGTKWDHLLPEHRRELALALARRIVELEEIVLALDDAACRAYDRATAGPG